MVAQVIKNQIEKIEHREKKIFWILFSEFVFLLFFYGFLVNRTIVNAVYSQKMEREMALLNSEVNHMDFQYLEMKNNITHELALSKGFVNTPRINFAFIKDTTSALSLSVSGN